MQIWKLSRPGIVWFVGSLFYVEKTNGIISPPDPRYIIMKLDGPRNLIIPPQGLPFGEVWEKTVLGIYGGKGGYKVYARFDGTLNLRMRL